MLHSYGRRIALCSSLAWSALAAGFAQRFEPLRSVGELSTDFTEPAAVRYRGKSESNREYARRERRSRDNFALQTSVFLNRLHRSGQVLTGDWVTELVRRVGEEVLAAAPKAPTDVRFYVLPSAEVNAFATTDHVIYVTMGLLARLESEAQLAFILAHEVGHVELGHSLELYLEGERIAQEQRSASLFGGSGGLDGFLAKQRYSRELEMRADSYAHGVFAKTGYSGADALGVFELLKMGFLPFALHDLTAADLEAPHTAFPEAWILDSVSTIVADTIDEESSSHPDTDARMAAARKQLQRVKGASAKTWSAEEFAAMLRQTRYEVTDYRLRDFELGEATNNALWLLANDPQPDTLFLRRTIVQAGTNMITLRGIFEGRKALSDGGRQRPNRPRDDDETEEPGEAWPGEHTSQGAMQRYAYLFATADVTELASYWLELSLKLESDFPELASARALSDRLMSQLETSPNFGAGAWLTERKEFTGSMASHRLAERFSESETYADLDQWNEADGERLRGVAAKGVALGLDSVLVLTPSYHYGTYGFGYRPRPLITEEGESRQLGLIENSMKAHGVAGDVLSDKLAIDSAPRLNEVRLANEWAEQFANLEPFRLIPHNHDAMLAMMDARGVEQIVNIYETETRIAGFNRGTLLYLDVLYGLVSPWDALVSIGSPRRQTVLMQTVAEPRSRKLLYNRMQRTRDRQQRVKERALYYDFFARVGNKSRR